MTTTIWNGATGNWGNAADWSTGVPDARNFDAQISAAGSYTLTVGPMAHLTVGMMEMTAPGAILAVAGRLTVGRTFDLTAGTLSLTFGGVIHGGTLIFDGGAAEFKFGTLDAVFVVGPLDVTRDFNWLNVTHGIDVTTGSGGAGVINLTGRGAVIVVAQLQLSRAYAQASFSVTDDGAGGSIITLGGAPGAAAAASPSTPNGLAQAMAGFAGPAGGHADETSHPAPPPAQILAVAHPYA